MVRTKASFRLIEYTSRLRIHERIYYTVDTVPVQVFHVSEIDSLLTYQVLDFLFVCVCRMTAHVPPCRFRRWHPARQSFQAGRWSAPPGNLHRLPYDHVCTTAKECQKSVNRPRKSVTVRLVGRQPTLCAALRASRLCRFSPMIPPRMTPFDTLLTLFHARKEGEKRKPNETRLKH
jgi:hypothetical protein